MKKANFQKGFWNYLNSCRNSYGFEFCGIGEVSVYIFVAHLAVNQSTGLATADGLVLPSNNSTNTKLTTELQKKSGSSWVKEYSWEASGEGTDTVYTSSLRYVVKGTYRVVVTAKIYSSSGSLLETQDITSKEVTY